MVASRATPAGIQIVLFRHPANQKEIKMHIKWKRNKIGITKFSFAVMFFMYSHVKLYNAMTGVMPA